MKIKLTISIILLFTLALTGQVKFNKVDSTYTFEYSDLTKIEDEIKLCIVEQKYMLDNITLMERENLLLRDQTETQSQKITKLESKDSLNIHTIDLYMQMDQLMREKLYRNNEIINNYKILLYSSEDRLRAEMKKAKTEKFWKTVYKFGYPALGILGGILLLK